MNQLRHQVIWFLRSADRNLQPLVDVAGIEDAEIFSKLKRGKRLTFAEMKDIRTNLELQVDGTLLPRYLKMEAEAETFVNSDPVWKHRIKTWEQLKRFGKFTDVSEISLSTRSRPKHLQRPEPSHLSKNSPSLQDIGPADMARSGRCGVSLTCQKICYVLYLAT